MASLEKRNGIYRIIFRFGGQKFSRSLKTRDAIEAASCLTQLNHNLQQHRLGNLEIRKNDDVATVLLSNGKARRKTKVKKRPPTLGACLDKYLDALPDQSIEPTTRKTLDIHVRHLKKHIGSRTRLKDVSLETLQSYVNARSRESGQRGKSVCAVTIRKELTTLTTVWSWATERGYVRRDLPKRNRLRFPKHDEKPPFKTLLEIERVVDLGQLSSEEVREHFDCVYLSAKEIAELLTHVVHHALHPFILPMVATAAYTGARRSELLRSQIEDIDLRGRHFLIREKKRVRGQRSTRSVPISNQLEFILTDWLASHPGGRSTFSLDGRPLSGEQARDHFNRTKEGSRWNVLPGWHALRHSFISNCASQGVDQRMIDDWVGHQTEAMRRRYRHLFPSRQREALDAVFDS